MKEIKHLTLPDDLHYSDSHEWVRADDGKLRVGISDYAQDQLGDIVFVELPQVGDTLDKKEEFGTVESVKAVAELYMPVSGEIVAVNKALEESPELLNKEPYGKGWIIEVQARDFTEVDLLMDKSAYFDTLKGLE